MKRKKKLIHTGVTLPVAMKKRLEEMADENMTSVSDLVRRAIDSFFKHSVDGGGIR